MAAEAIVYGALRAASAQATTLVLAQFKLFSGAKAEVDNLKNTLSIVQAFLHDAEMRRYKENSIKIWLQLLQYVAHDAEDVLDELATEFLCQRAEEAAWLWLGPVRHFLLHCFACFTTAPFLFEYQIARKIKAVRERLDWIVKEGRRLGIQESIARNSEHHGETEPRMHRETSSLFSGSAVVGRSKEKEQLMQILFSPHSADIDHSSFSVVSIRGMGGLGKTTLAQVVYNDKQVEGYFKLKMWAKVSNNFNPLELLIHIIESAEKKRPYVTTLDGLQTELKKILRGRLFLLVLDDVWDIDLLWEILLSSLKYGMAGSRVIVTTRNLSAVSVDIAPTFSISLEPLPFSDCWSIFQRCTGCSIMKGTSLEKMGEDIVRKAKGIPMAVRALGELVRTFGPKENRWKHVLEAEISQQSAGDVDIIPILRLSYQHLPSPLKQCFAFCALFPRGFLFDQNTLVRMWVALGFIQSRGNEQLEDVGSDGFDALLRGSFFQPAQGGGYLMHDFMHAVAVSVAEEEYFRVDDGDLDRIPCKVRHLSLSTVNPQIFKFLQRFPKLHSLVFLSQDLPISVCHLDNLLKHLTRLRLLHLPLTTEPSSTCYGINFKEFPESICSLRQLRYLHLHINGIKRLPGSLGTVYNLQNLKLEQCQKLDELPKGMTKLVNLRYLETDARDEVYKISGIRKLTALQELKVFSVGREVGHRLDELKDMRQLRGFLSISNLENASSRKEAEKAKLDNKEYIEGLKLEWAGRRSYTIDPKADEEVLEGLKPNFNLKDLAIMNYGGVRSPGWMQGQVLSFLETVRLIGCQNWRVLPPLGELQFLKVLELNGMGLAGQTPCFQFYEDGNYQGQLFPSLRTLRIWSKQQLVMFPTLPPTLTELRIDAKGFYANFVVLDRIKFSLPYGNVLKISDPMDILLPWKILQPVHWKVLRQLTISDCASLVELPREGFQFLVSLNALSVINCHKLRQLPPLPSSLVSLRICRANIICKAGLSFLANTQENSCVTDVSNLHSSSTLSSSPRLSSLQISECHYLQSLCEPMLGKHLCTLKSLTIEECISLASLPQDGFEALVSLNTLIISDCPILRRLPSFPPSLKYLRLNRVGLTALPELWSKDVTQGSSSLPSLQKLEIIGCKFIKTLCEGILVQDLKALEEVFICDCEELASLPGLGALSSLRIFTVFKCPMLISVAQNDIPVSLKTLEIDGCPLLLDQFKECCHGLQVSRPQIGYIGGQCCRLRPMSMTDHMGHALLSKKRKRWESHQKKDSRRFNSGRRQARASIMKNIFR